MILKTNVSLKEFTNYKIGGQADYFFEPETEKELFDGLFEWEKIDSGENNIFVLGGGTNLLVSDKGYKGLVIHNSIKGIKLMGDKINVGGGVLVSEILDFCIENSLTGLEWTGGLPGTIGGAVRGNAGAFKGEIKDSVVSIESIDIAKKEKRTRNKSECAFGYRTSCFKLTGDKEIITKVVLQLQKGDKEEIKREIEEKIEYRKNRHPLEYPNAGSIFKNISYDSLSAGLKTEWEPLIKNDPFPVIPVVKILLQCDLWEKRVGGAKFSDKHPNFIVNTDMAKSVDVKKLIEIAKKAVLDKFGIKLEEEIMYVGF